MKKHNRQTQKRQQPELLADFIQHNKLTRLTEQDLINYLKTNATGYKPFINKNKILNKEYYIDCSMCLDNLNIGNIVVPKTEPNTETAMQTYLWELYKSAKHISNETIRNGQVNFSKQDVPVMRNVLITNAFRIHHVIGRNKEERNNGADDIAEERNVKTSTTIPETSLCDFADEIEQNQKAYQNVYREIKHIAKENNRIISGIYFRTKNEYQMQTRTKNNPTVSESSHCRARFFYGLNKQNGKYYAHHFEDTKKKPDWEKLGDSTSEDNPIVCYYKLSK